MTKSLSSARSMLLAAASMLLGTCSEATVVVGFGTTQVVVIAADSRQSYQDGRTDDQGCKIVLVGRTALVATGNIVDVEAGLDMRRTMRAVAEGEPPFEEIRRRLQDALRRTWPSSVMGGRITLDIVRFPESGTPEVMALEFDRMTGGLSCPSIGTLGEHPWTVVRNLLVPSDEQEEIKRWLASSPSEPVMVRKAASLVERAANAHPETVGGPIDVLVLLPSGPKWIQRKDSCPAQ